MARAVAKVEQRIIVSGVDNASDAIKRAQGSLKGLRTSATRAGRAVGGASAIGKDAFSHGLPGLQGKHDSFNRLAAAAGGAGGALQESAHGIALLDAAMRLIPGPAGAAAASIAAAGAAVFLINKHISETRAQLRLLGRSDVGELAKQLDLSTEGAIKLSQALGDLPDAGLRPSVELLEQVRANAESMGREGADAVVAFTRALAGGPEALQKFQAEFGRIGASIKTLPKLAESLGLDAEALGLVKAQTEQHKATKRARDALLRVQRQQLELDVQRTAATDAYQRRLQASTGFARSLAEIEQRAAANKADAIEKQIAAERRLIAAVAEEVRQNKAAAEARQVAAQSVALIEASASAEADKRFRTILQEQAVIARTANARRELAAFDAKHTGALTDALRIERGKLAVQVLQARASANALRDARQQARTQAAAAARAQRSAIAAAQLRIAQARADRDGLRTQRERLALLDAERAKEIAGLASIKGARARSTARLAIDEQYATRRAALERQIAAESARITGQLVETITRQRAASAALAARAGRAEAAATAATVGERVERLRAAGQVERAELVQLRQARAEYAAQVRTIDADLAASRAQVSAESVDADNLSREAEAKRVAAKVRLAQVERQVDASRRQRDAEQLRNAAETFQQATQALQQAGQALGSAGTTALGQGLGVAADAAVRLAESSGNAAKQTTIAAGAVGSVGAIAIDADTQRTRAAIDADKERRLSTATTERERAAIVEQAEARKAAATEAGERRKAAILAAMEVAKAAAAFPNVPQMAAHGAAAALFGAVAGGVIGGGSTAAPGTAGGAGGGFSAATGPAQAPAGGGAGGGVTIINNFNQPLATRQDIGRATHGALQSLSTTGMAGTRGV